MQAGPAATEVMEHADSPKLQPLRKLSLPPLLLRPPLGSNRGLADAVSVAMNSHMIRILIVSA